MNPFQPSIDQAAQELEPEGLFLTGADIKTQYWATTAMGNCNGDDHGQTNHTMVLSHFQVQGIKPDIGILVFKWTMAKVLHQIIQVLCDSRNLAFVDPAQTQGFNQVIDFTGADTLDVGLLNHGQQGMFAALAWFQQAGEVRPLPQFGYPQRNLAYSRFPQPCAVAIAMGYSLRLSLNYGQ